MMPNIKNNTRDLTIRYIIGLSLIALLAITSQILVQLSLSQQADDSTVINIAGRQRMLSQRIAKNAARLAEAPNQTTLNLWLTELEESQTLWVESHIALQEGSTTFDFEPQNSQKIEQLFIEIEPHFQAITESVTCLLVIYQAAESSSCGQSPDEYVNIIFIHEDGFLTGMNTIVFQYDEEASIRVSRLRLIELCLLIVTLVVLLLEALLIFRPAALRIQDSVTKLIHSQQEQEQQLHIQKQVEAEFRNISQRFQLAIQAAHIGVWEWCSDTEQLIWDENMFQLHGVTPGPPTKGIAQWLDRVHPDDAEETQRRFVIAVESRLPIKTQFRIVTPDGTVRHILALADTYEDEHKATRIIGVNVDISDQKQAEAALRNALESEQALGEFKSQIVSVSSHEFRTPLATILATAETLTNYRHKLTPEQIDQRLEKIKEQVHHMKRITEDMLQFTSLQGNSQTITREWGDLCEFCQVITQEFNNQREYIGRVVFASTHADLQFAFDKKLMRQILSNLIHNGLKYSPQSTPVIVSLKNTEETVIIHVKDQGIGIPAADLTRLFDPFYRASNVGVIAGTGLGLSIAMRAAEKHAGVLTAVSTPEVGTIFTVTLPHGKPSISPA